MPMAAMLKPKAKSWIHAPPRPEKMATAAPNEAPAEAPRMSGETSGLRKMDW